MAGSSRTRIVIGIATGVTLLAVATVVWALWPRPAAVPQARRYLDVSACLLTGPGGVGSGAAAAPVWAVMQSVSLATHVMVNYLPVTSAADAPVLLNTLVQRRCGVIVTTGAAPAQVVRAAKANPGQRYVLVAGGGAIGGVPSNVTVVSAADVAAGIGQAIRALTAAA